MGVVSELGRYVLFVGLVVSLLDVGLGWTQWVGFGADTHRWNIGCWLGGWFWMGLSFVRVILYLGWIVSF